MNQKHLFAALGALAIAAAAHADNPPVKFTVPGQNDPAPAAAAPAAAAPQQQFTDEQLTEEFGWWIAKRLALTEVKFTPTELDGLTKGFTAALQGKPAPYDIDKAGPLMDKLMNEKQSGAVSDLKSKNQADAAKFFATLHENKNVQFTPSGLGYEIVKPGDGAYPVPTDTVKVNYTGKLLDGTVFDSSVPRGQPAEFALNGVIPGWTEGLQKINKGGSIRLYIPANLAYGDNGQQGAIPPASALIFDVDLLEVKPAAAAAPAPAPAQK